MSEPTQTGDDWGRASLPALAISVFLTVAFAVYALTHLDRLKAAALTEAGLGAAVRALGELDTTAPDLAALARGEPPSVRQRLRIAAAVEGGELYHLLIFDAEGRSRFDSALPGRDGPPPDLDTRAARAARYGAAEASIHYGTDRPDRPDRYVLAYLPLREAGGDIVGAVRAIMDMTDLSAPLSRALTQMAWSLVGGTAVCLALPALALAVRTRELRRRDRRLIELGRCDQLTGVLNRAAFQTEARAAFARAADKNAGVGVYFVDVDRFKAINDSFGHKAGDRMLRHVAQKIRGAVRGRDIVGRMGGDEFVVALPAIGAEELHSIGQRIRTSLRAPVDLGTARLRPSLSIGAYRAEPGEALETALQSADLAVYRAKDLGRDRLVEYTPALREEEDRRRGIEAALRAALARGAVDLVYLPIFRGTPLRVAGFEALLRLADAHGRTIPPADVIPVAERAGLMGALGDCALRTALAVARHWPAPTILSVNLSVRQFMDGTLPGTVATALDDHGFPAERLEVELTEAGLLDASGPVPAQVAALARSGIGLALDDFGNGGSTVDGLWRYPLRKVKIDRSVVEGLRVDRRKYMAVITAFISLIRGLGLTPAAEGVEEGAQLALLSELGCEEFQGYALHPPVAADATHALVEAAPRQSAQAQA